MNTLLREYLKKLTNISGSNRTLQMLRLPKAQFLDIHEFHAVTAQGKSYDIIESLIKRDKKIFLCPFIDPRDGESNELSSRLRKLQRMDNFVYEERGARDLYIGWPFIEGKFTDGTYLRTPLIYFPVKIWLESNNWYLKPRSEESVTLNKAFILAYAYYNDLAPDENLMDKVLDDILGDDISFKTRIYSLLKDSSIELNFNTNTFTTELETFQEKLKPEIEKTGSPGEIKLEMNAVLGLFPQTGSYQVPDYLKWLEKNEYEDVESFFMTKKIENILHEETASGYHSPIKEEELFLPFQVDAFQEDAIKTVKNGNSVVVHGPPGTGKSQLICNLVSDYISRGKNVLVVCQKRVALDVVYKRLSEIGLDKFSALVHDFKEDRRDIYYKIDSLINNLREFERLNNGLDTIQLERDFLQTCRRIDQINEELEDYKSALFDLEEFGLSIKDLYLKTDLNKPKVDLRQYYREFDQLRTEGFLQKSKSIRSFGSKFTQDNYPLSSRKSFSDLSIHDRQTILKYLGQMPDAAQKVKDVSNALLKRDLSFHEAEYIYNSREQIENLLSLIKSKQVYKAFVRMVNHSTDGKSDLKWLSGKERVIIDCFKKYGPETSLKASELGRFQEALEEAMTKRRNIFKWIRWRLFSKDKFFIKRVITANGLRYDREGFNILVEKIDNRLNLEHNLSDIKNKKWLSDLPETYEKVNFQTWFFNQKKALTAKIEFSNLRNFKEYFNLENISFKDLKASLEKLLDEFAVIPEYKSEWTTFFTEKLINRLMSEPERIRQVERAVLDDFDDLCEFDKLWESFAAHEKDVFNKVVEYQNSENNDNLNFEAVFLNSVYLSWIEHIEVKYPVLRLVSTTKFKQMIKELQYLVKKKQELVIEITLLNVRERTYEDLEFNRLNNRITYRDLEHQVTKKRKIWPIRKLVENFEEEIFKLLPCWLASPETVSAVFPFNRKVFDLVIFDEASQCFVEKGLPAIYRGSQVVVAGDEKQLRPHDLYKVRWDDDELDHPDLNIDSLLDLSKRYLPSVQLKGHYRSKTPDLISFSNKEFYNNNLRLLPNLKDVNQNEGAIDYIKVEGTWSDHKNEVEAQKVIDLLISIPDDYPGKTAGVVTFNARQQDLINDLIESEIMKGKRLPSDYFVKNIENVQGDETDILIFSTAYAPDAKGKMKMQFGLLNQDGGENRLNVAVTRAKERIIIVTSILPEQLKVKTSKFPGPKLLKKYLEYAKSVSDGEFKPSRIEYDVSKSGVYLTDKLKQLSSENAHEFILKEEMPFADLTVISKTGDYEALILTDDQQFYEGVSGKDWFAYLPIALKEKEWKYNHFYSRNYWLDSEKVNDKLRLIIH
ncbi:AAA domain-containing protein [Mangrovivirga sp. M17]|uniref:AAA domain-containing protein n=1 Tax=Mangrovivirga halotolerans TaxID=2993936 RepID=A0ABT3RQH8_9BACT|nr:AAA domain-containing protein [Mangrovivirga halotolerans]MCX2743425.1 AAA domain-containing protein [Mangrovivirga halotolerans]